MDESPHCALSGDGALEFALSLENFNEICAPKYLKDGNFPHQDIDVSNLEYQVFSDLVYTGGPLDQQAPRNAGAVAREPLSKTGSAGARPGQPGHDTVSAVAIDCHGHLACANSTGM